MMKIVALFALVAFAAAGPVDHVAERAAMIEHINNLPGVSWTAGAVPHFAGKVRASPSQLSIPTPPLL